MPPSISRRAGRSVFPRCRHTAAFVTLVMLDDGYIPGALVLGYALRRQNPEFPLICMITEEISSTLNFIGPCPSSAGRRPLGRPTHLCGEHKVLVAVQLPA